MFSSSGSTIDVEFDANGAGPQIIPNTIKADYAVSEGDGHIFVRINLVNDDGSGGGSGAGDVPEEFRK